jgi:hypothetical protein
MEGLGELADLIEEVSWVTTEVGNVRHTEGHVKTAAPVSKR